VTFKDITPLLRDPSALALAVEQMANPFRGKKIDIVVGAESRGFIFGTALAQSLSAGFVPIRKPKKLPFRRHSITYDLEYGSDTLEIHEDAIEPGQRTIVVDDVLATGGTMRAALDLVDKLGADVVGVTVLIELTFLNGRDRVKPYDGVQSVLKF
jgi:adenine phosphoribosyltransferase